MKANELRIGNLFQYQTSKGYDYDVFTTKYIQDLIDDPQDDFFEPIPLTEDWLVKMGFDKKKIGRNQFNMLFNWTNNIDIIQYDDGSFYFDNSIMVKIEYVHQLQNLYFALTGEELTIK